MQKQLILFLTIIISGVTKAQTALIKDPEGHCNIRQRASSQSKILDTLHNDRIVFVFEEEAEDNWLPVDYIKGKKTLSGYIHRSRIKLLSDLAKFKQAMLNDSILKLQLDDFQLTMTQVSFNKKGRQLKYDLPQGEQTFVKSIDNKFPWGTDGNLPKKEYKTIQFKNGNNTFNFPANMLSDLFEPNFDMTKAYFDKPTGNFYIEAVNSDGAGGYVVIWTMKGGQITRRETFIPF